MKSTDPLADLLTRIRNACRAKHKKVDVPSSRIKRNIARLLLEHNFIQNLVEVEDNKQNLLRIFLKYDHQNRSFITGLRRISKPSLRIYADQKDLDRMKREVGLTVLSTSKGILTHRQASEAQVGGEVLLKVW
ncbi:MAG: 30S ribosomal protein S8 [Candidatus Zixiibacteriota bacterium]|nr:MAG: 30S ribosomal protein S8 [candidate division Zixibacteria bacterium]